MNRRQLLKHAAALPLALSGAAGAAAAGPGGGPPPTTEDPVNWLRRNHPGELDCLFVKGQDGTGLFFYVLPNGRVFWKHWGCGQNQDYELEPDTDAIYCYGLVMRMRCGVKPDGSPGFYLDAKPGKLEGFAE